MTTKTYTHSGLALLLILALMVPVLASAQNTNRAQRESTTGDRVNNVNVCERIDDWREQVLAKVSERADSVVDRGDSRNNNVDTRREERVSKLETQRSQKESEREEYYSSLMSKADTDEKVAAVEEFASTVESLKEERQSAIDSAVTAFEDSVESLKENMQDVTSSLEASVEDKMNSIFDDAENACTDDSTMADMRKIINEGMSAMRIEQQSNRENYSFRNELDALREVRKAAFDSATETFKAGLEEAKEALRGAFSVSVSE